MPDYLLNSTKLNLFRAESGNGGKSFTGSLPVLNQFCSFLILCVPLLKQCCSFLIQTLRSPKLQLGVTLLKAVCS